MGPKGKGVNTKVLAANEKKAKAQAEKDAKKTAEEERNAAAEWSKGADTRAAKRREEAERKAQEEDRKRQELRELQKKEEEELGKLKKVVKGGKTKAQRDMDKPWEMALKEAAKPSNKGSRKKSGPAAAAKASAARDSDDDVDLPVNRNREVGVISASGVDAALAALSVESKEIDKHPEKKAKAAYKAFEARMLPQLKEEMPGLKLSQYKEKLFEIWKKSPENPLNQVPR